MESEYRGRAPSFELRDFLFYLIPGAAILSSLLAIVRPEPSLVKDLGFSGALAAIFLSYFFGQIVYPLTYLLRWLLAPADLAKEDSEEFAAPHFRLIEQHPVFYTVVVFRDRSFARFSLAMVFPTALFGSFLGVALLACNPWLGSSAIALGFVAAAGFCIRYRHYERRYRTEVLRAELVFGTRALGTNVNK